MTARLLTPLLAAGRRAWRLTLVVGLVLAFLPRTGDVSAQAVQPGGVFSWEIVPCPVAPASPGEVEGRTYDCGVVVVPENRDKPNGRTIELAFMRLRSTSAMPAPDPLVYLAGGPGESSIHTMMIPEMLLSLNYVRKTRDIIAYDQRGTGWSGLIVCGPFQAAIGVLAEERPEMAATIDDIMGQGYGYSAMYGACAQGYTSRGVDLAQYNSVSSAHDIVALTRVLGYTSGYNLYGLSYGSRLAQTAMRSTPGQIRSVILDGVTSPSTPAATRTAGKMFEQYQNIFMLCAADPACNAAYPNLEARFIALLKRLATDPIVVDPPITPKQSVQIKFRNQISMVSPAFFIMLADLANTRNYREYGTIAPRLIMELERGDTTFLRAVLAETAPALPAPANAAEAGREVIKPDQTFFAKTIDVLLDRGHEATSAPNGPAEAWVAHVIAELRQRLLAGDRQSDIVKALAQMTLLPTDGIKAESLIAYADRTLSPETAAKTNAIARQMSRHDIRLTMWHVQDIAAAMGGEDERSLSDGTMRAVNCSEEFPFVTKADVQAYLDSSPYPGLVVWTPDIVEALYLVACQFYPPTVLDRSYTDPVVSDIQTLIYLEMLDTQTPLSWGLLTRKGMKNSFLVQWQTEGHVVMHRSPDGCAGSIAAAFLADPRREPDLSCSRAPRYQLTFVLPDKPWSPPSGP